MSFDPATDSIECLSALMDGELDSADVARACAQWRNDGALRASWHAYQVIGDVLRSDDLACRVSGNAASLAALRARLAEEPVVLAPQAWVGALPAEASPGGRRRVAGARRWSWVAPSAVAAGFVAVAGVLVVTRGPGLSSDRTLASSSTPSVSREALRPVSESFSENPMTPLRADPEPAVTMTGKMWRDARLDRYLAAHKQFAPGSSALGMPSGFLRSATADASNR